MVHKVIGKIDINDIISPPPPPPPHINFMIKINNRSNS